MVVAGAPAIVMADLDPAIHAPAADRMGGAGRVDYRVKPGDDDLRWSSTTLLQLARLNRRAVGQARRRGRSLALAQNNRIPCTGHRGLVPGSDVRRLPRKA